jgi:hypothetical protein
MENEHIQAILSVRKGLIDGHQKYLDGGGNPDVAMCKQKDAAFIIERAISQLEEILKAARDVVFQ